MPIASPITWLQRPEDASGLDIFCLGWSAPPTAVTITQRERAVVTITNPTTSTWVKTFIKTANTYDNLRIIAWSWGVLTASRLLGDIKTNDYVAINGVVDPFSSAMSREQAQAMAANLTPGALATFQRGLCGSKSALSAWQSLPGHPNLAHAQAALQWWIDLADQPIQVPAAQWSTAIIGSHDRIMNPQAQEAAWKVLSPDRVHVISAHHWMPERLCSAN